MVTELVVSLETTAPNTSNHRALAALLRLLFVPGRDCCDLLESLSWTFDICERVNQNTEVVAQQTASIELGWHSDL